MKIGVVGSGKYKNKKFVIKKLEETVNKEYDIVVSGHSPRNKFDNVDIWAEVWANANCKNEPIIFPPKTHKQKTDFGVSGAFVYDEKSFFKRNKSIAKESEILLVFINKGQFKSGAWNTVKHFLEKLSFHFRNLVIFNEFGMPWHSTDLPIWMIRKMGWYE